MKYALLLLVPSMFVFAQTSTVENNARVGFESIKAEDLRTYLTYLTSDELQGRETSYAGERLAAKYIAEHFKSLGLTPVGDQGSYFQHYDVDVARVSDSSRIVLNVSGATETFGWIKDFIGFGSRDTSVGGRVAFVGYMNSRTPDIDKPALAGRVAIAFAGLRKSPGDTSRAPMPRRMAAAARRDSGVVLTLIITDEGGPASYSQIVSQLNSAGATRGRMSLKGEPLRQGRQGSMSFYVSPALAGAILKASGMSLEELRSKAGRDSIFAPVLVNDVTIGINSTLEREQRQAENVVGLLAGSDPTRNKNVVIFSAHFDHLGVGSDGAIYRGADDDGSGTAMVMELAQAFAENPVKPKSSILFLAVSGEEKGLLGSSYYTSHPIIPLDQTIADFNTDMIGRMDTTHEKTAAVAYTYLIGSDKISTELDSILQVANRESNSIQFDYRYNDDRDPNQYYRRSDHYNFARKGVPIAFFFTGEHADYHRPTDTIDKILFDRMVKIGQVVFYAGWKTANASRMLVKNGTGSGYKDMLPPARIP